MQGTNSVTRSYSYTACSHLILGFFEEIKIYSRRLACQYRYCPITCNAFPSLSLFVRQTDRERHDLIYIGTGKCPDKAACQPKKFWQIPYWHSWVVIPARESRVAVQMYRLNTVWKGETTVDIFFNNYSNIRNG